MTIPQYTASAMFILALSGLMLNRTHLLSSLLCLEAMMISLFLTISIWSMQMEATNFLVTPMLLLAFSACEASAGLALLIASSRTHGSDRLQGLNLLVC